MSRVDLEERMHTEGGAISKYHGTMCTELCMYVHCYTEEDGSELKIEELSGSCLDKQ